MADPKQPKTQEWKQPQESSPEEERRLEARRKELDAIWAKSQATQRAKNSPSEAMRLREQAAEMVLRDGGIRVHTSVESDLSPKESAGYQDLETRIQDGLHTASALGAIQGSLWSQEDSEFHDVRGILKKRGINEIIDIRYEGKRPIFESVTVPGKKGFLGMGKTPDRVEQRETGRYEVIQHCDIVENGKKEAAIRITYHARGDDYDDNTGWRDYSGRFGQEMTAEIVLPESTGKQVADMLKRDPALIRTIVERIMKEKILSDPEAWDRPYQMGDTLRPPYEQWDNKNQGGRIYVLTEDMEPGFHEEAFRRINTPTLNTPPDEEDIIDLTDEVDLMPDDSE